MTRTIKVKGMSCMHCVKAITKALEEIQGVDRVQVDLNSGEVTFEEAAPLDAGILQDKVKKAGFELG